MQRPFWVVLVISSACGGVAGELERARNDAGFVRDAGVVRFDDAGSTPVDAGSTPVDAGSTPADAGLTPVDAGREPFDGGAHVQDGGFVVDFRVFSTASSPQTSVPVTLGQVFAKGDVFGSLGAHLSTGATLPVQVDPKARYPDGSLKHAIVTVVLPSLSAKAAETVSLTRASVATGSPVSLSTLLGTAFDATVRITQSGRVYTASARSLLMANPPATWLEGPLVTEWRVGGPISDASGAHPHLAVYFHVRCYAGAQAVRVDAVVENGWSYVDGATDQTYDVQFEVGQQTRSSTTGLKHFSHARWHQVEWWGTAAPATNPQQNRSYLTNTKAVPRYLPLTPTEAQLASLTTSVAPMTNGDLEDYMPTGGPSSSIGPLPAWATAWVLSEDDRARRSTLANADAGGAYSIHFRNERSGEPSSGWPVSIADHPNAGTNGDFPSSSTTTPLTADTAHQPSVAYLAYLITGDLFYLEELQFWVHWNWLNGNEISVNCRQREAGLVNCHQERGQAWALRELGRAAWVTPDAHPLKALYLAALDANRRWYASTYLPGGSSHNVFGAIDRGLLGTESGRQETKTWMDDFFTWAVGHLLELGFSDWRPLLDFKSAFVLGRLTGNDFCYIMAGNDTISLATAATAPWRTSWAAVYQATFAPELTTAPCGSQAMANALSAANGATYRAGEIFNYASMAGSRLAIMHSATAVLVDQGVPGADAAWSRVRGSTVLPDWSEYQNFALQPR